MHGPTVFVSCGQFTEAERSLGKVICEFINTETRYQAYFAEQQSTFDGLINNIFAALARASALVAVMHHRGIVNTPTGPLTRGSVWVEQEVAIGAFVHHVLKRPLEVALYIQRGVALEGVRQQLLLGATVFDTPNDVLMNLRQRISSWQLSAAGRKSLIAEWRSYSVAPPKADRNEYKLEVKLRNTGLESVDEWKIEIWFPSDYYPAPNPDKDYIYWFTAHSSYPPDHEKRRLWPGEVREFITIDYYVGNNIRPLHPRWPNEVEADRFVRIRVVGGDQPWEVQIRMKDL